MLETPSFVFAINAVLCAAAFAYHVLEKWAEFADGAHITLGDFWRAQPAKNWSGVIATVISFAGCYMIGWTDPPAVVACGYMGDSVVRRLVGKFTDA